MAKDILVYPNKQTVAQVATTRFLLTIADLLATKPLVHVAVTGGGVGTLMLQNITSHPLTSLIDWTRVHVWWGDERFVPAQDPDRNALQAREAVLDYLVAVQHMSADTIHEMPASDAGLELDAAAQAYQRELAAYFSADEGFDITLFGMGPDAHFASLFPGLPQVELNDPDQWVVGVTDSPKLPPLRLSLTVPFITRSRRIWFFADGEAKAEAAALALSKPNNPAAPSSFGEGRDQTLWMLDQAAAAQLANTTTDASQSRNTTPGTSQSWDTASSTSQSCNTITDTSQGC